MKKHKTSAYFDFNQLTEKQKTKLSPYKAKNPIPGYYFLPRTIKMLVRHESGYIFNFDLK